MQGKRPCLLLHDTSSVPPLGSPSLAEQFGEPQLPTEPLQDPALQRDVGSHQQPMKPPTCAQSQGPTGSPACPQLSEMATVPSSRERRDPGSHNRRCTCCAVCSGWVGGEPAASCSPGRPRHRHVPAEAGGEGTGQPEFFGRSRDTISWTWHGSASCPVLS